MSGLGRLLNATKPGNKIKLVLSFYQIVTKVDEVYEVTMPAQVRAVMSIFTLGVSFGLGSSTDVLTCLGFIGFLPRLIFWMVLPAVLVVLILVGIRLQRKPHCAARRLRPCIGRCACECARRIRSIGSAQA